MSIKKLREIPNPYFPIKTNIPSKEFVGRTEELHQFRIQLEEYKATLKTSNILITGEKSIGKSTLLNRFLSLLDDFNFCVVHQELSRDSSIDINEFEFFRDLIDSLFIKYAPPEGSFFDQAQSDIWFSLTSSTYSHESSYIDRKLLFPTQYANYKNNIRESLSYQRLENDFEKILDELTGSEMEFIGLVIVIDEFQELSRNPIVLDILRRLSENLVGITIIGAGLPQLVDNSLFEKFIRTAINMDLKRFNKSDILNLIYKPLETHLNLPKHQIEKWFDKSSLIDLIVRSDGNPMHIHILCAKMVDYFKSNISLKLLGLNKAVMEAVMEYYSNISSKSRKIQLALKSCNYDQLDYFRLLYCYEQFSIREAIILENAFSPMTNENENQQKKTFTDAFKDIWNLNLFELINETLSLNQLLDLSTDELSQIEYKFIGNTIDKLYASYYYEELTNKELIQRSNRSFEDALGFKLAIEFKTHLSDLFVGEKNVFTTTPIINIRSADISEYSDKENVTADLDKISSTTKEQIKNVKKRELVSSLADKYDLKFPAILTSIIDEIKGNFLIIAHVTIRGKQRIIFTHFPIIENIEKFITFQRDVKEIKIDETQFKQYFIKINYICFYVIPKIPLHTIALVDVGKEREALFNEVKQRNFSNAVKYAESIMFLNSTLYPNRKVSFYIDDMNNYAFCLININLLSDAKRHLSNIQDKYLISRINLAFLNFFGKNDHDGRQILNKVVKKELGKNEKASFLHLTLLHPKLAIENVIVEDVCLFNVACWNLALINAYCKRSEPAVFSFLKKVHLTAQEAFIDKRVRSWIYYYYKNIDKALDIANALLSEPNLPDYIRRDTARDIEIFLIEAT